MASDDDSVLRNHYNNNDTTTAAVSSSTAQTSDSTSVASITIGFNAAATSNYSSSRYPGTGFTVGGSPRIANTEGHTSETQPRREENPFSFKHFLSRDSSITASSSTSTSSTLGSCSNSNLQNNSNEQFKNSPNNNTNPINGDTRDGGGTLSSPMPDAVPTSVAFTAASNAAGSRSNISVASTTTTSSYQSATGARPKVPQSFLGGQPSQSPMQSSSVSASSISSLVGEGQRMKRSPRFSSFDSQASLAEFAGGTSSGMSGANLKADDNAIGDSSNNSMSNFYPNGPDFDRQQYVHRSFSNYDMDGVPSVSPHRSGISPPGGLSSNPHHPNHINLNAAASGRRSGGRQSSSSKNHQAPMGPHIHGNRPVSEYSAALPDFVQDHWMDQWYCSLDMNINSPPNSPISPVGFGDDIHNVSNPADICQTLPDFLSDDPIIHSAARLADVAAGLPGLDSPEENLPSLQLSRLRLENDRLRAELDENRQALAEQTRRAGELERRLEQVRSNETAYSASLAQSMEQVEETLDQSKKRAAAAQNQVAKLKQQIKQLTAEVDSLRRENEALREDGAVGGDRVARRPSRTQQLSRDLRRAASTAENNLRQLLTGVENLRLMASTIENMERLEGDGSSQVNPIINEEYLSDSDVDYDEFTGPAL